MAKPLTQGVILLGKNDTEHIFHLDPRYDLKKAKILGAGSFGVVCSAHDRVRNETVAVKKLSVYCGDEWDAQHVLREVRMLKLFSSHPNFVTLYALSVVPNAEMYMILELMNTDLFKVLHSNQSLSESKCKCIMKQILEGIKAMHAVNVFHRDIKPGNILLNSDCRVKITDFGLARYMHDSTLHGENDIHMLTKRVVTTIYRSPELLLSPKDTVYTSAIDIWSVGCIFGEFYTRKPIFHGTTEVKIMQKIFEQFGYKTQSELGFPISEEMQRYIKNHCRYPGQPLQQSLPGITLEALQVVTVLLNLNPNHRFTAETALQLPFFNDAMLLCEYNQEFVTMPTPEYFAFEIEDLSLKHLKRLIHDEVASLSTNNYDPSLLLQQGGGAGGGGEGSVDSGDSSPAAAAAVIVNSNNGNSNYRLSRPNSAIAMNGSEAPPSQAPTEPRQAQPQQQPQPSANHSRQRPAAKGSNGSNPFAHNSAATDAAAAAATAASRLRSTSNESNLSTGSITSPPGEGEPSTYSNNHAASLLRAVTEEEGPQDATGTVTAAQPFPQATTVRSAKDNGSKYQQVHVPAGHHPPQAPAAVVGCLPSLFALFRHR